LQPFPAKFAPPCRYACILWRSVNAGTVPHVWKLLRPAHEKSQHGFPCSAQADLSTKRGNPLRNCSAGVVPCIAEQVSKGGTESIVPGLYEAVRGTAKESLLSTARREKNEPMWWRPARPAPQNPFGRTHSTSPSPEGHPHSWNILARRSG